MSWPTKTIYPFFICMSTSGNKPNHSVTGEHNLLQNKTAKCYPNHHSGNVCLGVHNYKTYNIRWDSTNIFFFFFKYVRPASKAWAL